MGSWWLNQRRRYLARCLRIEEIYRVFNLHDMVLVRKAIVDGDCWWVIIPLFCWKILTELLWTWPIIDKHCNTSAVPQETWKTWHRTWFFVTTSYNFFLLVSLVFVFCFSTKCFDWTLCSVCSLLPISYPIMHDYVLSTLLLVISLLLFNSCPWRMC